MKQYCLARGSHSRVSAAVVAVLAALMAVVVCTVVAGALRGIAAVRVARSWWYCLLLSLLCKELTIRCFLVRYDSCPSHFFVTTSNAQMSEVKSKGHLIPLTGASLCPVEKQARPGSSKPLDLSPGLCLSCVRAKTH